MAIGESDSLAARLWLLGALYQGGSLWAAEALHWELKLNLAK